MCGIPCCDLLWESCRVPVRQFTGWCVFENQLLSLPIPPLDLVAFCCSPPHQYAACCHHQVTDDEGGLIERAALEPPQVAGRATRCVIHHRGRAAATATGPSERLPSFVDALHGRSGGAAIMWWATWPRAVQRRASGPRRRWHRPERLKQETKESVVARAGSRHALHDTEHAWKASYVNPSCGSRARNGDFRYPS